MAQDSRTYTGSQVADQRLRRLLGYVWEHSRFYRELYRDHGISAADIPDLSVRDLPFVSKEMLVKHFDDAVTDPRLRNDELQGWLDTNTNPRDTYRGEFIVVRTSGGSSTVGTFVYDTRAWQTMSTTVAPRLHLGDAAPAVRFRNAAYVITGRHTGGATTAVHASSMARDTLLVSFHDPEDEVIRQLNAFQPHRVTSYSSGVARLAELTLEGNLSISPRQVVVSGDRLTPTMETTICEAWNAPIYDIYAAAESFFIATKTSGEQAWTVFDELNTLEVLDGDRPAAPGERGRAVLTNLFNHSLPIIRYELCDHLVRGPASEHGTQLLDIGGKSHDVLPVTLENGELGTIPVYELSAFRVPGVDSVQFVSERPDRIALEYRAPHPCDEQVRVEGRRLLERYGASRTTCSARRVDRIWNSERTAKFQWVRRPGDEMIRPRATTAGSTPAPSVHRVTPTNPYTEFDLADTEGSVVQGFERQVERSEQHIAIEDGSASLSYDSLNRSANRLARALVETSTERTERVALMFGHGSAMIVGILGVLKAGKMFVPLDPSYPPARLAMVLQSARARLVIADAEHVELARAAAPSECRILPLDDIESTRSGGNLELTSLPDAPTCLIYTSGSTGEPKGVVHNHRSLLHRVMSYTNDYHISRSDRICLIQRYTFNASLRDIFGALLNGATVFPYDLKKNGLNHLARWLIDEGLTVFYSVPTLFRDFVATLTDEQFPELRLIRLGGEPVSRRDVEGYRRHFSSNCILVNALATTEAGTIRQYFIDKKTPIVGNRVPVGDAVAGKEVVLLDNTGQTVGTDVVGEIAVKSRYLAMGYWSRQYLSREAFVPVSDAEGMRLHRTGDLGFMLPDQRLIHVGRKDSQVNIRGHRVETEEIELSLTDIESVRASVVVARESENDSQSLVAYVVPMIQPGPLGGELRRELSRTLPAFMVPSTIVTLEALPTLPNGKVDRAALPAPGNDRPQIDTLFVAARNRTEQIVADVWSSVLGIPCVGMHDDFLHLGGDSLQAFRILSQIRLVLGIDVPVRVLFDAPTIASMAAFIGALPASSPSSDPSASG